MSPLRNLPRCLLALAIAGAAGLPTAQSAEKIGVLLKGRSAFWNSMEKGAIEAAQKSGVEVVVKAPPSEGDVSVQIQLLNAMAKQGFSAIVLSPANQDALAGPAAAIAAHGTKVVVLESPLAGDASHVFVGTDHEQAGAAAGKLLATLVTDSDEVSFLNHSQTNTATLAREKGAMAKFREAHAKSVVHADIYASAEAGAEIEKARLLLAQYPATKAIFASGTAGTLAMLQVLQEKNLAGTIKLVGFGFNLSPEIAKAIGEGKMHGWIAWQPRELGAKGVATALAVVKGEKVPAFVNTDFVVVTPQNLHDEKVQALLAL